MRYLLINSVVDYGSTGKITRQLSNALEIEGEDILVTYGRVRQADSKNSFFFGNAISSGTHLLLSRIFGRHGLHSTKKTKQLIRKIKEFSPDVIHLHNLHGYYLNVELLFEFLKTQDHIKIIWTLHDCWAVSGSSAYFSFNGCKEWDEGCVICNSTADYPKASFIKRQRKNFAWKKESFTSVPNMKIITPSNWLRDLISTTFLKEYPVQTIYNGLNLDVFKPKKTNESSPSIKLLGVSNIWEERKGLTDFIKLRSMLPSNYEITLIGLSKKQISKLPEGITGIERTSDIDELVQFYSDADIYLNFSVEETMGMTTIEAIACGTPAFVFDQTAVPEIVNESVGKVFKAHDLDEVVKSIKNYKRGDYAIEDLLSHADKFKESDMIDAYMREYQSNE